MKLDVLDSWEVQEVRKWRNAEPQFLRTPYLLTEEMQEKFFDEVINNRDSKHRYFAIIDDEFPEVIVKTETKQRLYTGFIGMGGLTNIEWENGTAEISLIINPEYRRQGKGSKAVDLILHEAFAQMRLYSVYGEVYDCANRAFWEKIVEQYDCYFTNLKNRKMYNGKMYDSMWFSINESVS